MTSREQLELWIKGQNVHNHEKFYDIVDDNDVVIKREKLQGGECCPDFSCCHPEGAWDQGAREVFYKAFISDDQKLVHEMLMNALGGLVASPSVYVAGLSNNEGQQVN